MISPQNFYYYGLQLKNLKKAQKKDVLNTPYSVF